MQIRRGRIAYPCVQSYVERMIDTLPVHHFARVISLLRAGDIVAFPTGTTYGFGVDATNTSALKKLETVKGRTPDKAFSILLPTTAVDTYVSMAPEEQHALETFANAPLTLLVKAQPALEHLAKDGRVGVRTADHPFTSELMKLIDVPVTATSANGTGQPAAMSIDELMKAFPNETFMAVDGGTLPPKKPSTVASWENGSWKIWREGDVKAVDLKKTSAAGGNPPQK